MKRVFTFFMSVAVLTAMVANSNADLINEFEPNPPGTDPTDVMVELTGTPLAAFTGFLSSIESDVTSGSGQIDRSAAVSGSYDANGFAVVTIPDLENPSFTFLFSSLDGGGTGTDYDTNNDGTLDVSTAAFGTIFDAIGIPDSGTDLLYGTQLGGADFTFPGDGSTGNEPTIAFRDGTTGAWTANYDFLGGLGGPGVTNLGGTTLTGTFDLDPSMTTFGTVNPSYTVPEPSSVGIIAMVVGFGLIRRRK